MKNIRDFYLKNFQFLEVKLSIYLNRCVFVMKWHLKHCDMPDVIVFFFFVLFF